MQQVRSVEQILPTLRAILTQELMSNHSLSKKDIANLICVTPSAVTQYAGQRRGRLTETLVARKEIRLLLSDLATRLASNRGTTPEMRSAQIVESAYQILSVLKGSSFEHRLKPPPESESRIRLLRGRLETELREASRSLELANSVNDDFVKMLFREIATDSMRHADIVSHLMGKLDPTETAMDASMKTHLKQMEEEENRAADEPLSRLIKTRHPAIKALLRSIDADEDKHRKMLRGLSSKF
jgi:predicted transcriptional regulator